MKSEKLQSVNSKNRVIQQISREVEDSMIETDSPNIREWLKILDIYIF